MNDDFENSAFDDEANIDYDTVPVDWDDPVAVAEYKKELQAYVEATIEAHEHAAANKGKPDLPSPYTHYKELQALRTELTDAVETSRDLPEHGDLQRQLSALDHIFEYLLASAEKGEPLRHFSLALRAQNHYRQTRLALETLAEITREKPSFKKI